MFAFAAPVVGWPLVAAHPAVPLILNPLQSASTSVRASWRVCLCHKQSIHHRERFVNSVNAPPIDSSGARS
jgi:hypothetical protein